MAKDNGMFQVVDGADHRRVHFESANEDEARAFMVANSPRPHVVDGYVVPQVVLLPNNEYHAGNGVFESVEE